MHQTTTAVITLSSTVRGSRTSNTRTTSTSSLNVTRRTHDPL